MKQTLFIFCCFSCCSQLPKNSIHLYGNIYGNKDKIIDSISLPYPIDTNTIYSEVFADIYK